MITIKHILKDGTEVANIENKMIKIDDFHALYEVIKRIQKEGENTEPIRTPEAGT